MPKEDPCLFCRIAKKEIQSDLLYEDQELVAIRDLHPKAPVHVLILPKKHVKDHLGLREEDCGWMGRAHLLANQLVQNLKAEQDGFRVVINCGRRAGQTVDHLHLHVMGGRDFNWPPG